MNNTVNYNVNTSVESVISAVALATSMFAASTDVQAYDLQENTIYANAKGAVYKIELNSSATTAVKVADTNESLSSMGDIAFDGSTMYGANLHKQLLKLEPSAEITEAVNDATSFSLQFHGMEARDGVLYGAETRSLVILDQVTGNPVTGTGLMGYGLSNMTVADLAFDDDGTLYAIAQFDGISYSYFATINTSTGEIMILGNTGTEYVRAITVKDGEVYAMNYTGNFYSMNKVSGFATIIAEDVLPGVFGMDTSPTVINFGNPVDGEGQGADAGTGEGAGGSLAWFSLIMVAVTSVVRRIR